MTMRSGRASGQWCAVMNFPLRPGPQRISSKTRCTPCRARVPYGAEVLGRRHDGSRREPAHRFEDEREDVLGSKLEDLGFERFGALRCVRPRGLVCGQPIAHRRRHLVRRDGEPIQQRLQGVVSRQGGSADCCTVIRRQQRDDPTAPCPPVVTAFPPPDASHQRRAAIRRKSERVWGGVVLVYCTRSFASAWTPRERHAGHSARTVPGRVVERADEPRASRPKRAAARRARRAGGRATPRHARRGCGCPARRPSRRPRARPRAPRRRAPPSPCSGCGARRGRSSSPSSITAKSS